MIDDQFIATCFAPPLTLQDKELLKKMVRATSSALVEMGIRHILYGGAMLGHLIYDDLLPWDDDVDIILFDEIKIDDLRTLVKPFEVLNNKVAKVYDPSRPQLELYPFSTPFIDLTYMYVVGDQCIHESLLGGYDIFPKDMVFPLVKTDLAFIPHDVRSVCLKKYGPSCLESAPPPTFNHYTFEYTNFQQVRVPIADINRIHRYGIDTITLL